MTSVSAYPKRLIEVDLPIKKISEHARREKSIRHGHISTLHIWWARRPLAACRAVICAALWPDPADPLCPDSFKIEAKKQMGQFWNTVDTTARNVDDPIELRKALLDFIADFSNWDNSTNKRFLITAQKLTQSAHESLGGEPGTRPLVVDPFAGGGSIPLEALRVGADAYASDLNPVAVLLNKVILEYIPKYGQELAFEVRKSGQRVKEEAEKELAEFYPKDPDGAIPIAYLWARTITCEGPGCGAEIPLIRSLWLAKSGKNSIALRLIPNADKKRVSIDIIEGATSRDVCDGTVRRSSAICPLCGFTTPADQVRNQVKKKRGGTCDARLIAIRFDNSKTGRRGFRLPIESDYLAAQAANIELNHRIREATASLSLVPDEELPYLRSIFNIKLLGVDTWGLLFSPRQILSLIVFAEKVRNIDTNREKHLSNDMSVAVKTCLALGIDRLADFNSSLCILNSTGGRGVVHTFGRQALGIVWDYLETNPFNEVGANWDAGIDALEKNIELGKVISNVGTISMCSASEHPLPNDSVNLFATDPPYYDAVPYADLSDFFYVWLKRTIAVEHPNLFKELLTQKNGEIVQLAERNVKYKYKTREYFENLMQHAMYEGRRILQPSGIGVVVFAHKTTIGWEAQLQAMINAGWTITASWPIDTERPGRLRAQNSAVLASSIHLVCRPRENTDGALREDIGDWQDILRELLVRTHEWMPRLKEENVIGADAIFACLGPALEIFSQYSRVERASGDLVTLKEYLEKVWEAVENEALKMIFEGVDTSGFGEDARLTAMWLWTLKGGATGDSTSQPEDIEDEIGEDNDETPKGKTIKVTGFSLEYDAARKISQGLGAHPEEMPTLIEINKGNARLLSVMERAPYLFGKKDTISKRKSKERDAQLTLFPDETTPEEIADSSTLGELSTVGRTTLDRVHQSMLLFGNGQSEALKRFLVEEGVGNDPQFKNLAQALVALYPEGSDEKRWAEGVMNRMKGLGL
jgi:adenine-specific DNA methylase